MDHAVLGGVHPYVEDSEVCSRDGRRAHIFNPSAFSQGLFSIVLIATGTSDLTWGDQISTSLCLGPNPYLFLFGIGLLAMHYFSTTLVS